MAVLFEPDSIAELRVPKSDRGPQSGLFDDLDKMADAAAEISGKVPGVYVTMNPVKESLRGRVKKQLATRSSAVKDNDIDCRRWLLLDFDPVRPSKSPSKSPSTDAEHDESVAVATDCRKTLRELGWPEPVLADSGNGAHLLYRIDLPNDAKNYQVVKSCLESLALEFSTDAVELDSSNGNASRLTLDYGTMNRKGTQSDGRPYRRSQMLEVPEEIETVSVEMLERMAGALPLAPTINAGPRFDVAGWLKKFACTFLCIEQDFSSFGFRHTASHFPSAQPE